jgi:hypothetical protein
MPYQSELALRNALRDHGWIDGRDLIIDYRFSLPPDRQSASVADLIAVKPRCAHCRGTASNASPEIGNCHLCVPKT